MMNKLNKNIKILFFLFFVFFVFTSNTNARRIDIEVPQITNELEYDSFEDDYDLNYNPIDVPSNKIAVWDPFEKMNRKIYEFNEFVLIYLARPIYYNFYIKITTEGMRKSINNIAINLRMPIIFANYVLQLNFKNASKTLYTFIMNSTYGIFGIYNVAGHQGVTPQKTDLGITLAKYHVPPGPYLMLPFFGPNDIRGLISWVTEISVDPLNFNVFRIGGKKELLNDWLVYFRSTLYVVDNASYVIVNFYDIMKSSFDPYSMMKDAYGQSQYYKINNKNK